MLLPKYECTHKKLPPDPSLWLKSQFYQNQMESNPSQSILSFSLCLDIGFSAPHKNKLFVQFAMLWITTTLGHFVHAHTIEFPCRIVQIQTPKSITHTHFTVLHSSIDLHEVFAQWMGAQRARREKNQFVAFFLFSYFFFCALNWDGILHVAHVFTCTHAHGEGVGWLVVQKGPGAKLIHTFAQKKSNKTETTLQQRCENVQCQRAYSTYMYQLFALPMSALCGFSMCIVVACYSHQLLSSCAHTNSSASLRHHHPPPPRPFCLPLSLTVHLLKICALYSFCFARFFFIFIAIMAFQSFMLSFSSHSHSHSHSRHVRFVRDLCYMWLYNGILLEHSMVLWYKKQQEKMNQTHTSTQDESEKIKSSAHTER